MGIATAIALTMVAGGSVAGVAVADDHTMPSRHDVQQSREAVRGAAADVESVRAQLVLANQRLEASAQRAANRSFRSLAASWSPTRRRRK